jgi:hypothetical protein
MFGFFSQPTRLISHLWVLRTSTGIGIVDVGCAGVPNTTYQSFEFDIFDNKRTCKPSLFKRRGFPSDYYSLDRTSTETLNPPVLVKNTDTHLPTGIAHSFFEMVANLKANKS